jgi:integrase/recombinase XerD
MDTIRGIPKITDRRCKPRDPRLAWFGARLRAHGHHPSTIRKCTIHACAFLTYLESHGLTLDSVTLQDLEAFLRADHRAYCRTHKGHRRNPDIRRKDFTSSIHKLLSWTTDQWPPIRNESWREDYARMLREKGFRPLFVTRYLHQAQRFVDRIGIDIKSVSVADLTRYQMREWHAFARRRRGLAPRVRGRCPLTKRGWIAWRIVPVRKLLALAQGSWPPPNEYTRQASLIRDELIRRGYPKRQATTHGSRCAQFTRWLEARGMTPRTANRAALDEYLRGRGTGCGSALKRFLREAQGRWPPAPETPPGEWGQLQVELFAEYGRFVDSTDERSRIRREREAGHFLAWLRSRIAVSDFRRLSLAQVDQFMRERFEGLRRATRATITTEVRRFLAFLYAAGYVQADLSDQIPWPRQYAFENIPKGLSEEQVDAILKAAATDRTPLGRRDYAMLCLLQTYGLRAGEVIQLQLSDINWREDSLKIVQSKSGRLNVLPLIDPAGTALFNYVTRARPATPVRRIFVRHRAPIDVPLSRPTLYVAIQRALARAKVHLDGKRGSHAFRYARAASLLDAKVPPKMIGDVLGHRSAQATHTYLRLPTKALRAVGLNLPRHP